nr:Fic family protein [Serpentinicella alkaliphila]
MSTRMFLRLHKVILRESRVKTRSPSEYRKVQNFIGPTTKIEDATYIPPEPQFVTQYMSNLEKYINDEFEDNFGVLSRAAIIHGQFETIHPFLDCNGRLGRILIIIYLLDKKVITHPTFFVSEELEKNKYKYYVLLNGLRTENPKWKEWIIFYLHASIKQAEKYIAKLLDIENMYNILIDFAKKVKISLDTILFIFKKPIFTVNGMKDDLGISYNIAKRYTNKLLESGKIYADDKKRNTIYRFYDLIDKL